MIDSADEFVRLRHSDKPEEYNRAAEDEASTQTWLDVIQRYPDAQFWVAQNKTVPLEVLEALARSSDEWVRSMVRSKGRWRRAHPDDYKRLGDLE